MAANDPSRTIGRIDCPVCGEDMPVRQNGRDTLNISCPWCGVSSYSKGGTEANKIIAGWIRRTAPQADDHGKDPEPASVIAPVVKPVAKSASAMPWDL